MESVAVNRTSIMTFKGKGDLYPRLFKAAGSFTRGTLLSLAVVAAQAPTADAQLINTALAAGEPIRPESTGREVTGKQAEDTGAARTEITAPGDMERLERLNLLSEALVEKAGSGSASAYEFRLETRMYRELLRQAMLNNHSKPTGDQLPQQLLLDMVRLSALLHAAAACKTGLVIVCPADLIRQLRSQQSRVTQALEMTETTYKH